MSVFYVTSFTNHATSFICRVFHVVEMLKKSLKNNFCCYAFFSCVYLLRAVSKVIEPWDWSTRFQNSLKMSFIGLRWLSICRPFFESPGLRSGCYGDCEKTLSLTSFWICSFFEDSLFIASNVNFNNLSVPMNIMCRNVWCNVQC